MAKTSSVEKNNRRRKLADQYGPKRAALKAIIMDQSKPMEERFRAQLKLAALPRNSAKIRIRNARRDANKLVDTEHKGGIIPEDDAKRGKDDIQELTKTYETKVDDMIEHKRKEVMEV